MIEDAPSRSRWDRDVALLFTTRIARLFAYGFVSVILALYLAALGFSEGRIGLILTAILAGDAAVSLLITTTADRIGRRRMLVLGAILMAAAGAVFLATRDPWVLTIAAILGILSPSGNEIGPFLSIEQASLSQLVTARGRTRTFAWYNLVGSFATAVGALAGGLLAHALQERGIQPLASYRAVLAGYALTGCLLAALFLLLSRRIEAPAATMTGRRILGLHASRGVVFRLSALFSLDAFAGGFVVQSLLAYWFHLRFGVEAGTLGPLFFGANLLAGLSALLAARIASRIGLINTMVFTHLPSNLLLCLVPLMPSLPLAIGVLLLRFSISQMDVPTRQSYTMAVVAPDERAAAAGMTTIARSVGASISPALSGALLPLAVGAPFFLAGGLKVVYDLLLWRSFRKHRPPEEMERPGLRKTTETEALGMGLNRRIEADPQVGTVDRDAALGGSGVIGQEATTARTERPRAEESGGPGPTAG